MNGVGKKEFKNNPALRFISMTEVTEEAPASSAPASDLSDLQRAPAADTKSKRVQLLVSPRLCARIDSIAARKGLSRNEAINEALRLYAATEEKA